MALFSTRSVYGLCAISELLEATAENPMPMKKIAEVTEISQNYIEQLFNILKNNGILSSIRGSRGGYYLGRKAEEITIKEICTILDGAIQSTNADIKSSDLTLYFYQKDEKLNELFDEPLSNLLALRKTINYNI